MTNITPTEVNRNFVIRVNEKGSKTTKLVGAGKYSELVGEALQIKHFKNVFLNGKHKTTFNLRRGLTVNFCSK